MFPERKTVWDITEEGFTGLASSTAMIWTYSGPAWLHCMKVPRTYWNGVGRYGPCTPRPLPAFCLWKTSTKEYKVNLRNENTQKQKKTVKEDQIIIVYSLSIATDI